MTFDLHAYLDTRRRAVEAALQDCLPGPGFRPAVLAEALRHAVLAGGKRLRPILCLASAEAAGGPADAALLPACAVELLHAYTLVHDDLPCMDDDQLRRGLPTVHAQYGEALGVLAGDALQALAFAALARCPEPRPGAAARLAAELAEAATGVVAGQVEDIRFAGAATRDTLEFVFLHKTADLFRAACRLGALAAGAAPADLERLTAYAEHLGFAFQITDDLLDAAPPAAGEPAELTCLQVMSEPEARDWAARHTAAALAALDGLPGDAAPLAALASELLNRLD